MKILFVVLTSAVVVLLAACVRQPSTANPQANQSKTSILLSPSADLVRSHMAVLAADDMQGREAGTSGFDKAAAYVADEFKKLGLASGGDSGSYFQQVSFRRSVRDAERVSLQVLSSDGTALPLQESVDYLVSGSLQKSQSNITAGVVFAGFGIVAPELGRDDYAGLDVEGKLVATLARTPPGIQSEERAFYGLRKAAEASKRGALGVISLYTPVAEKVYAFERIHKEGRMDTARLGWLDDSGKVYSRAPNLQVSATFSMPGASKLFAGADASWEDILRAAETEGAIIPTFALPYNINIKQSSKFSEVRSANVIGVIPGSDPELSKQVLVLSAHLDGIGIATTDEEDVINNGALDNAAGIATLLETARMLMSQESRPRRTVLFLANTAEEKGLLGAQYFVKNPTLAGHDIVGNINLDMPVLTYDFQDVIVFGGDRSSLRGAIQSAAKQMNIAIGEDPFPEQGIFTRSDHFRFVEAGIPSVMLATGMANGGQQAWDEHFAKHYHRPSDDMNNNIDFDAAAKFAELKTRITLQVANADERPLWNKRDFFGRQFDGPMAE